MSNMTEEDRRDFMEEMRHDMQVENYEDSQYEIRMRTDDDFWWSELQGRIDDAPFSDVADILRSMCNNYDRVYKDERDFIVSTYL